MALKRLCLMVNPHGGYQKGLAVLRQVKPIFDAACIELDIHETEYAGHAQAIVQSVDLTDVDGFCAIGGDGTLHEVLNGLLSHPYKPDLPLGLIPAGTGNSFLRDLDCLDPVKAAKRIVVGKTQPIDVARISMGGQIRYACNVIGWGLVTDILIRSEQLRWLGESRYTVASALEVLRGKRRPARLIADGQVTDDSFIFVLACNTRHTGKGMLMAPRALLSDGLIDLIIVKQATRTQLLCLLPKVFDGSHVTSPLLEYRQVQEFSLQPQADEPINIDGELIHGTPVDVKMIPAAFRFLI